MKLTLIKNLAIVAATSATMASAWTQNVDVKDAWVRATVQGQKSTGAFMTLTAKAPMRLVGVTASVAGVAEVHEMKMEGDVMKMRALDKGLELPAGKAVALKPGGYHLMLMDLKMPLKADTAVPVTLVFKDAKGVETRMDLKLPVALNVPGQGGAMQHGDGHMGH